MMPSLAIEYQDRRVGARLGWILLGAAALFGVGVFHTQATLEGEVAVLEQHLQGKTRHTASPVTVDGRSAKPIEAEAGEAREVLQRLSVPWHTLFQSIERAHIDDVALIAVQPDAQRRSMTVVGEAKEYNDVLTYVTRLRSEAPLTDVYLVGNEAKESDPHRPLLFTIAAQWRVAQ